ncbi:hypothetical protein E3N88_32945 [Mikania micrantha]|uniref:DUF4219 domain-containing protein n=1 Tax=Mikania micrantha TaxID=192012 RepID=A0A5N6M9U0_9ASTR|nr:hypothetical protein E3N88_32945 [Mikania micrantha]
MSRESSALMSTGESKFPTAFSEERRPKRPAGASSGEDRRFDDLDRRCVVYQQKKSDFLSKKDEKTGCNVEQHRPTPEKEPVKERPWPELFSGVRPRTKTARSENMAMVPIKEGGSMSYQVPVLTPTNYPVWAVKVKTIMDAYRPMGDCRREDIRVIHHNSLSPLVNEGNNCEPVSYLMRYGYNQCDSTTSEMVQLDKNQAGTIFVKIRKKLA